MSSGGREGVGDGRSTGIFCGHKYVVFVARKRGGAESMTAWVALEYGPCCYSHICPAPVSALKNYFTAPAPACWCVAHCCCYT